LDQEAAERTLVAADDPEAPVALDELRLALRSLPDEQREALVLVGAGGFAYEEAADICGCAVGTVKSRVSRARRALQAILEAGAYERGGGSALGPGKTPVSRAHRALQAILEAGAYERDGGSASDAMRTILSDAERLSTTR